MASAAYKRDGHLSGLATGLDDLDRLMGGLQASDLIILAGRPGMGKTSLATNIGFNIAKAWRGEVQPDGSMKTVDGGIVGLFSLEMSAEQLATRIIAEQSGVSSANIRRGRIDEAEFARIVEASREMQRIPLLHRPDRRPVDRPARRPRPAAQAPARPRPPDHRLYPAPAGTSRRGSDNRVQEVTEITTTLKALAKELHVPILALSQLSRQVENRDDKRPQLSDLRESGSIEQDADVVLFVFREEYYLKNQQPKQGTEEFFKWQDEMSKVHGIAEVIIGKQRHGPTGTVRLQFEDSLTRFSNLAAGRAPAGPLRGVGPRRRPAPCPRNGCGSPPIPVRWRRSQGVERCSNGCSARRTTAAAAARPAAPGMLVVSRKVPATPERAFAVFVDGFDSWWPRAIHLAKDNLAEIGIEPK